MYNTLYPVRRREATSVTGRYRDCLILQLSVRDRKAMKMHAVAFTITTVIQILFYLHNYEIQNCGVS